MSGIGNLNMVNLDAEDPRQLTEFYAKLLGWKIVMNHDAYGMISNDQGMSIGFGKIDKYTTTEWPDKNGLKRYHIDVDVTDMEKAKEELIKLGATVAPSQPNPDAWTVMLDPQGHPFDIVPKKK